MMSYLNLGRMGRFANGLFEIAGTIGIAIKCNQNYGFPLWINWDAKERFGSTEDIELYKHFVNPLPLVPDGLTWNDEPYFWGYRELWHNKRLHSGNWNMNAHFQSDKYFNHSIDTIRHYFTMENEHDYSNVTAVHMRFGDYDDNYHPRPKEEYYRQALELLPDNNILLFSDDPAAAKGIMKRLDRSYVSVDEDYIGSFKIMKRCGNFVCGNSSYGLMAAILSDVPDKKIICPKKWFGDHVSLETADLFPENSIVI